jgi:hypothetical protein
MIAKTNDKKTFQNPLDSEIARVFAYDSPLSDGFLVKMKS